MLLRNSKLIINNFMLALVLLVVLFVMSCAVVPPGAVSCKFDRILPFWSNHAVNAPYSCSFLSKFESQAYPSLGKRLGCAAALYTVLLFVLCMHSAKPVQNIQLSPQIRESVLSHFTGCFLLQRKWKRNFFSDEGE